jgi:hypothetical protein
MKKLSLIAAAIALASSSAFAATTTDSFDVSVNFTGACTVKTAASDISFTYAAFGAAQTASTSTVFECSRGLTPTFVFNDNGGTQTASAAAALGTAITGEGVISGVRYTLSGSTARSTTGSAASAGTGGTGGSNGSADEYTVSITANLPGNQAGNGASGTGTHTRTLTITY